MKLDNYAIIINKLLEKYPDAEMVYSIDDEGNEFNPINFPPIAGNYDREKGNFNSIVKPINAVCVN